MKQRCSLISKLPYPSLLFLHSNDHPPRPCIYLFSFTCGLSFPVECRLCEDRVFFLSFCFAVQCLQRPDRGLARSGCSINICRRLSETRFPLLPSISNSETNGWALSSKGIDRPLEAFGHTQVLGKSHMSVLHAVAPTPFSMGASNDAGQMVCRPLWREA